MAERPSAQQRLVLIPVRTVLAVIVIVLAVAALIQIVYLSRQVITWILVAIFLALALNPAVEWFQRHGVRRRGYATAVTFLLAILVIAGMGSLFVPTLVNEVNDFATALPVYVEDVVEGRGRLGDLAERYDVVERVQAAVEDGGAARILGLSGTAIAITKGVITAIVAIVTIAFLTFFMLLEGPVWVQRLYGLLPERSRPRWERIARDVYRTIGGYVTGNLLISIIAGTISTLLLLATGVSFAVALGLLVAILDLVPLAGATLAAVIVSTIAFIDQGLAVGLIVVVFFVLYQQLENHVIQPVVYSRTVQLSPLAILIAVLIGAKLAGVLGALGAIPVAGTVQVLFLEWLSARRGSAGAAAAPAAKA